MKATVTVLVAALATAQAFHAISFSAGCKQRYLLSASPQDSSSIKMGVEASDEVVPMPTRIPIGSTPQFAIAGDSTEETAYQRAVVGAHFAASAANLWQVCQSLHVVTPLDTFAVVATVLLSIVAGDFGTGVFHWSVDNYGSIKTPVFGSVCAAFQGHHDTPWTITFRPFCNNVFKIAYGTIPPLLLLLGSTMGSLPRLFLTLFINWWLLSQELHKYSHMRVVPPAVKKLQDWNIFLSRKEHGLHHTAPYEGHYCILTGMCNSFLDQTQFFRHLENIVFKLTGNRPNTWKIDPELEKRSRELRLF